VPSDGTVQEAYQYTGIVKADNVDETYQYTGIVKADNVDETWPKWQHVEIAQVAY
jgi:hypothetical protein